MAGSSWPSPCPGKSVPCVRMRPPTVASVVSLLRKTSIAWRMTEVSGTTYTSRQAMHRCDADCRACALPVLRDISIAEAYHLTSHISKPYVLCYKRLGNSEAPPWPGTPGAVLRASGPMFLDKVPVNRNTKTGQVVQMDHPIAHGRTCGVQTMLDGMALRIPVRFHRKGTGTER